MSHITHRSITSNSAPFHFLKPLLYLTKQPQLAISTSPPHTTQHPQLTITLLVPRPRPWTPKLLRLAPPIIRHQQRTVVLHKRLLQLILSVLVDVLLVVGDDALGDGLTDGVDLRRVPAARDAHADVDRGELVEAEYEEGFVDLGGSVRGG